MVGWAVMVDAHAMSHHRAAASLQAAA